MARPTRTDLLRLFDFNLEEGRVFWRMPPENRSHLKGNEAGFPRLSRNGKFYWIIKIGRKPWGRGHLIYFVKHKRWPKPLLDHHNGNSLDDRASNLRPATIHQNAWNHKGRKRSINLPMGVRYTKSGSFQARISHYGKQIHIGVFPTEAAASEAYRQKRTELFGEYA